MSHLRDLQQKLAGSFDFSQLFQLGFAAEVAEKISQKNCENLIGSVEVPVGVAGPVPVYSKELQEELLLPLATTEGALVASVSRGAKALRFAGGSQVLVRKIGMSRAPVFQCISGLAAQNFLDWFETHLAEFTAACEVTSQHLKYLSHLSWQRGRHVYIRFVFDTDEAMGMNMVSIGLQAGWQEMKARYHEELGEVELLSLSSNLCADKKDSQINRLLGRGYWVQAEVVLPGQVVQEVLKTTPEQLLSTHVAKNLVGSNLAGSFSQNMHIGNVIAAMYLATGQDLAHVTEGSQASTTIEKTGDGIYAAVTLPNLNLGTVGGGTWLPKQARARRLIRQGQELTTAQLAIAIATASLAGELSGMAALSTNTLAAAHQKLGRIAKDAT